MVLLSIRPYMLQYQLTRQRVPTDMELCDSYRENPSLYDWIEGLFHMRKLKYDTIRLVKHTMDGEVTGSSREPTPAVLLNGHAAKISLYLCP